MSHILRPHAGAQEEALDRAPVTLDLVRFDPASDEGPRLQRYAVPYRRRMSIFTALREIYEQQDRTLAFRNQQCGRGICGTCRVRVDLERLGLDHKSVKSCSIPIEPGDHVVVRPAYEKRVIRDLVVDF